MTTSLGSSDSSSGSDSSNLQVALGEIQDACDLGTKSQFFPQGGSGYKASVSQFYESSMKMAQAAVQPGSEDLQSIVMIIAKANIDFAVKGGGHTSNPGFSSTTGLQIYMTRFNQIRIDKEKKLVHVGAGCLFKEIYQALGPTGLNIVGGSGLAEVGVAGWMLGGGYSVKTSQYGLGTDNLAAVKLILPTGDYIEANETTNADLFFAIKGGGNNFGIVTELTLKAHDQGGYEDFTLTYNDHFDKVKGAILNIIAKQDNKANIEATFRCFNEPGTTEIQVTLVVECVYDGTYSDDPFEELEKIPYIDNSRHEDTSFLDADLRRSFDNGTCHHILKPPKGRARSTKHYTAGKGCALLPMLGIGQFPRGRWGNAMVDEFTPGIINEVQKQAFETAKKMKDHGGLSVSVGFWPFTRAMFDKATVSAWPHVKGKPNCPIIVYFTWKDEENDPYWIHTMQETLETLRTMVRQERPSSKGLPYMINTALAEATTVEDIYGDNLSRLSKIRKRYDPKDVMGRTGGFRIPLSDD